MSKQIIVSGQERKLSSPISFILSFFITGAGEIYSGSAQRGIALALLRAASALAVPFYSMTNAANSHLDEVFVSLFFFAVITFFSPFYALTISIRKRKIVVTKLSSAKFIALFTIFNTIITVISITVFLSFFSISKANKNYPPAIEISDIVVIKKIGNNHYDRGELAVVENNGLNFVRVIGQPGEKISYKKGRFSSEGSELFLSIFNEDELKAFSLTDFDVISETQGSIKYPVIQNRDKYSMNIVLNNDEYFAAPDDRNDISQFITIKGDKIYGRMEGVLFSIKRKKILIKPFRITE